MNRLLALVFAAGCMVAAAAGPAEARRVALVIGNSQYQSLSSLDNPSVDAAAVAGALRAHGFEVFDYFDLERADMLDVLEEFKREADQSEVALVYYAGHGMEIEGRNVLAPVDMEIACDTREARRAVEVDKLFAALGDAPQQIVLLDACRNDPFPQCPTRSTRAGNGFRGFQLVRSEEQSILIANATLSGQLAADGDPGRHSPFAAALLARFETDGASPLRDLLDQTARDVRLSTRGGQVPEITTQGGAPRICLDEANCAFNGGPGQEGVDVAASPAEAANLLVRLGYDMGDGDAAFAEALRRFQATAGLPADGRLTATTMLVLRATAMQVAALPQSPRQEAPSGPAAEAATEFRVGATFRDCPTCPEMVVIPGGLYRMGAGDDDPAGTDAERPAHDVMIARPLAVSRFEVTFDEWEACLLDGGCLDGSPEPYRPEDNGWGRGRQPVLNISWDDAKAYADWLRRKTGHRYRLLSEAEWEYAARGGTTTPFAGGARIDLAMANFDPFGTPGIVGEALSRTAEVGQYPPNPFGLHDMAGNVGEWVEDCWNDSHAGAPADGSARGGDCTRRVLRGGAWYYEADYARSAARQAFPQGARLNITGLRVARELE